MFKTTIAALVILASPLITSTSLADIELGEIIDIPVDSSSEFDESTTFDFPIEEIIISDLHHAQPLYCSEHNTAHNGLSHRVKRSLVAIDRQVKCGHLSQALREITVLQKIIRSQIAGGTSQTERGFCYEDRNCRGDLVVKTIVEKGSCDAASGKSWKRTNPTTGTCQNI